MSDAEVAVRAVSKIINGCEHPSNAWTAAAQELFIGKRASIERGCQRGAFLGLCEEGFVRGVEGGNYTRTSLKKMYAIKAVELLKDNRGSYDCHPLCKEVLAGLGTDTKKLHNSQMNVVLALWDANLIVTD